jgi:hypothetical protein
MGAILAGLGCLLLLAAKAVPPQEASPILHLAGDWDTNHGVVYLDQENERISAEFDYQGKRDNRLMGVLKGMTLEATFEQPSFPPPLHRGRAILTSIGLASAIALLTDSELHRTVAAAACLRVRVHFCADRVVPMYEECYRS